MDYFNGCYSEAEIKNRYREWAMKLHPDKGGTDEDFRELQTQYEHAINSISTLPQLYELFKAEGIYQYHRQPVTYTHCDHHYYYFILKSGCNLQIDAQHTELIKTTYAYL